MDAIVKRDLEEVAGFKDWIPEDAMALEKILSVIRRHYEAAGFTPLRTPLVERTKVLLAKAEGEIGQQIYALRLMNPAPNSPTDEKDLALRFDHTVPLVRLVAAKQSALLFPFRRHVIGPVIRGEKPKDGRYREFIQADVDVIGDGQLSFDHDAEMISIIHGIFEELDFGPFTIRINNRKILTGFLASIGCDTGERVRAARDAIDAVDKVGHDATVLALGRLGIKEEDALHALELLTKRYSTADAFALLRSRDFGPEFAEGIEDLSRVIDSVKLLGVPEGRYCIDLSVARALDYYTSTVYEARLDEYPHIGSIAGGGRFDNLAEKLSSRKFPGVGISIGVDRLLRRLIKLKIVDTKKKSVASVLVASENYEAEKAEHIRRGQVLRAAGIPTEVYLQKRGRGAQLQSAAKRGIPVAVYTHTKEDGGPTGLIVVRNVHSGDQAEVHPDNLIETVQKMLL
jgi:histidyl-tRNA synthetase